ncbi:MAG: hypothetical protein WBV78_14815, partial [Roseobacter sp.]
MSKKIIAVAIGAEIIIIAAGLSLAATIGWQSFTEHQNATLALSAAAFPLILACLELFKIPAGYSLYKASWIMKPFAAILLIGGVVATFETVTMAGSTWFRSVQYDVMEAQTNLVAMEERKAGLVTDASFAPQHAVVSALQDQLDSLKGTGANAAFKEARAERAALLTRFSDMRDKFGAEWDAQTSDNERRATSTNAAIAAEAVASQRSLPSRSNYIAAQMAEWERSEGALIAAEIERINSSIAVAEKQQTVSNENDETIAAVQDQLAEANAALLMAQRAAAQAATDKITLGVDIEKARLVVGEMASASIIYDIAAKVYAVPVVEVTEEQANEITKWIVGGVAAAAALSTGMAAFIAAHIASPPPALSLGQALRRYVVGRRWRRKQTVEKIVYNDRVITRYLPSTDTVKNVGGNSVIA